MVTILPQAAVLISVSACAPAAMERASAASTSSTTTSRCTGVQWRSYRRSLAAAPTDPSDFCRRYKRAGHPSSSAPSAPNRRVTARPKASVLKATAAARSGTSTFMSKFTTRTCHGNLFAERVRSVLQRYSKGIEEMTGALLARTRIVLAVNLLAEQRPVIAFIPECSLLHPGQRRAFIMRRAAGRHRCRTSRR